MKPTKRDFHIASNYGDHPHNFHIDKFSDELHVTLTYPPRADEENKNNQCRYICVDQESVRASDGVRLHYDFERDGFVIEQASTFSWSVDDVNCDSDWQEVAFVKSWGREDMETL